MYISVKRSHVFWISMAVSAFGYTMGVLAVKTLTPEDPKKDEKRGPRRFKNSDVVDFATFRKHKK